MADINSRHSSFRSKVHNVNMLNYLTKRSISCKVENDSKCFTKQLWDTAKDLYKKDLTAHYGCVNAIEFSNDGNLLFSGGDDCRVLMWNVNNAMMYYTGKMGDGSKPKIMRACHFSNIFCLAVDDENKRILSGSNDDQVIVHDFRTGNPVDYFLHDSPVFSLSLHPTNGNIFASAVDNGRILIYDIRETNSEPVCLANFRTPFHGVMFNPCEPFLIATANSKVGVHIWDLRKPRQVLYECCDEQSMAVRWNQLGNIVLALRNLLPPVIYNPRYPKRKLEFDADGYYNACTMKSCSFAGDNDEYVLSGSDDFNLYMWKIPEPWPENRWVPKAHLTLTGHRSIVNQVRYDPNKQLIASSGVEKIIKIWSPIRVPYSEGDRDKPCEKRPRVLCSSRACSRSPGLLNHDYSHESVDEDTKMIHFFDSLLRNELHGSTPSSFSQFFCVDGKVFLVSNRRKEAKAYEQLIIKKKKHLSKILTGKNDDNPPVCSLSQVSNNSENHSKKYHFSLEDNQLLTASEDEGSNAGESLDTSQEQENDNTGSLNENSPVSSDNTRSPSLSSSSTSSSSSSSAISNSRLESIFDSPYGSESHSSDHSDAISHSSHSTCRLDLYGSKRKYYFTNSESEDSNDPDENPNNSSNFKDSGVNVSASSDSDVTATPSFKKRRISSKNRCYRNSGRRKVSVSSTNSSDVESTSKRKEATETKTEECENGVKDQKSLNSDVISNSKCDLGNNSKDESNL
ncbi:UNVERIFIED_CONTAM: hypothetical protein PYX00_007181 [Menopon gallinae]|uniref:Uncharacterized protein n=1 Tax=Menopon gallinae TaxID=328185 RepID=A0AAW2HIV9_9NEOP